MKVLLIVATSAIAHAAGMGVHGAHLKNRDVEFHWPTLGTERLRGKRYDVVIVDSHVYRHNEGRRFLEEAKAILCRWSDAVWIDP